MDPRFQEILAMRNNCWRPKELLNDYYRSSASSRPIPYHQGIYPSINQLLSVWANAHVTRSLLLCSWCLPEHGSASAVCPLALGGGTDFSHLRDVDYNIRQCRWLGPAVHHPGHLQYALSSSDASTSQGRAWLRYSWKHSELNNKIAYPCRYRRPFKGYWAWQRSLLSYKFPVCRQRLLICSLLPRLEIIIQKLY